MHRQQVMSRNVAGRQCSSAPRGGAARAIATAHVAPRRAARRARGASCAAFFKLGSFTLGGKPSSADDGGFSERPAYGKREMLKIGDLDVSPMGMGTWSWWARLRACVWLLMGIAVTKCERVAVPAVCGCGRRGGCCAGPPMRCEAMRGGRRGGRFRHVRRAPDQCPQGTLCKSQPQPPAAPNSGATASCLITAKRWTQSCRRWVAALFGRCISCISTFLNIMMI